MSLTSDGVGIALNVVSISTSKIVLDIPKGYDGKSFTFTLATPIKGITASSKTFSLGDNNTPNVTLSPTNISANS